MQRSTFHALAFTAIALTAAAVTRGATPTGSTVAADGSGDFKTVQEAVNAAPQISSTPDRPFVIRVKPGVYEELVYIQREKRFVALVGDDAATTVIRHHLHANMKAPDGNIIGTFRTPTVQCDADDFTFANLTIQNTAGAVGQALALRCDGDRVAFSNCTFTGWQDTIFLNRGRQYFDACTIAGATDFIFGGATAFFEKCTIEVLGGGYITAASTPDFQPFGFVFDHCTIRAGKPPATATTGPATRREVRTFLGRPWRGYAHTVFLNTEMSDVVRPEGWNNWGKPEREKTSRYAEYRSTGPGAAPDRRVGWARPLSDDEARQLGPKSVLGNWDPSAQLSAARVSGNP